MIGPVQASCPPLTPSKERGNLDRNGSCLHFGASTSAGSISTLQNGLSAIDLGPAPGVYVCAGWS
jgi:hypothetical protein